MARTIGHFDHMNADTTRLALGVFAGLGQAFDQFLAEFVHARPRQRS
jgi:hypothetical protein